MFQLSQDNKKRDFSALQDLQKDTAIEIENRKKKPCNIGSFLVNIK